MDAPDEWSAPREWIFGAGQSKRIWNELYKVFIKYFVFILCRQGKIINILYCNNTPMPVSVDLIFDLKPFFIGVTEYEIYTFFTSLDLSPILIQGGGRL